MYRLRKLSFAFGLVGLLSSTQVAALGLGSAEVNSALNQPLQADIQLNNLGDMDAEDIIIRLASPAAFENAGINRLDFYDELQFEVVEQSNGDATVRVTTQDPVREPYLSFLVEARWASGRLMREYTFLLDLPTYDDERAQEPVQAPSSGGEMGGNANQTTTAAQETPSESTEAQAQQEARRSTGGGGSVYGPVEANETLWEIAMQARPGNDLTVQQTMLAIQQQNPEAFINGNINLLRRGQVLRLPSRQQIQAMSHNDAVRRVAQQNRDWSEQRGVQLDAGRRAIADRSGPAQPQGQLTLATPGSDEAEEAGQGTGASDSDGQALEAELASTREELDKTRRENRELSSRVEELEAQIETMESLIEASNEQLRALQVASEQSQQEQSQQQADTESASEEADKTSATEVSGEEAVAEESQTESSQDAVAEVSSPEENRADPADSDTEEADEAEPERDNRRVVRSLPEPTFMEQVKDNILFLGGGLLALILGGVYLIQRRRQTDAEAGSFGDDLYDEEDFLPTDNDDLALKDEGEPTIDLAESSEVAEESSPLEEEDTGPETNGAVLEAETYIAYGKWDEAESLLLKALDDEPGSVPVTSKLLEVYAQTNNTEAFDKHYENLRVSGDASALERADELRRTLEQGQAPGGDGPDDLADAGEFGGEQDFSDLSLDEQPSDSDPVNSATDEDFDLDLGELEGAEAESEQTPEFDLNLDSDSSEGSDDLDFALDFDLDDEAQASDGLNAETTGSDQDFDLSLDDDTLSLDETEETSTNANLDTDEAPETAEEGGTARAEEPVDTSEELSFDADLSSPDATETPAPSSEDLSLDLDDGDDFDPNLDVGDVDLAALDEEMGDLDAGEAEPSSELAGDTAEDTQEAGSDQPSERSEQEPVSEAASDEDMDAELDFLADADEAATKLDLARAYIDMGDAEGAKDILSEVTEEGNDQQKQEAEELMNRIE